MKTKFALFYVFLFGILISTLAFSPFILDYTLSPRLFTISLVLMVLCYCLLRFNQKIKIDMDGITISLIAYTIFSFLSVFWANTKSEALFENLRVTVFLGVFCFGVYFFKRLPANTIIIALAKLSMLICLVELILFLFQLTDLRSMEKEQLYNVYGINSHKNLLSSFIFLQLFFLIIGFKNLSKTWSRISLLFIMVNLVMIAILQTKAIWIGTLVAVTVYALLHFYKRSSIKLNVRYCIAICIILSNLFFILVLPKFIQKGIDHNVNKNHSKNLIANTELDNERLILWNKTYMLFQKNLLAGVGAGNWQINFPDQTLTGLYRAEDLNYTFQRPHNDLLWILSETGLIGFNLYLLFLFGVLVLLVSLLKKKQTDQSLCFKIQVSICIIIGFSVASFFDFPKERIEHLLWFALILAYSYSLAIQQVKTTPFFQFHLNTNSYLFALTLFGVCLLSTGLRFKGEYFTRKMYDRKSQQDNIAVLLHSKKATSFIYSIDPTSIPIKWYAANANAALTNFKEARTDLTKAVELTPYNRNVLNDLASSYVATGQIELAIKYYQESARISPRFDEPKLNLTVTYINTKQYQKADSCLNTLFHDSERRNTYQKMVNAFLGKPF